MVSDPPSAAGISITGIANNLSIKSNEFTGFSLPYSPFFITKDRGISLGTNTTGTNNEISANNFNDETLTLHDAIYANGFQNMRYCSNTLSGSRENAHGFNFKGTCTGTDLTGNIMTFGDASSAFSSTALLIQGNTQIGVQLNKGNEWHNLLGSEPFRHAECLAFPADNKFLVHTQQSTCANESDPTCFFKYHPRKVDPDNSDEFFKLDPMGSPAGGCNDHPETDELDRKIAQGLYVSPIDDPAMGWVLERYLYQKFKANPALINDHTSFPLFMLNKESGTVGKFYEIQQAIKTGIQPSEGINTQTQLILTNLDSLTKDIQELDEQIETAVSSSELTLLYLAKKGLMAQINDLNAVLDSLRTVYRHQAAINLQSAYSLNQSVSATHLYELNEKTVTHIYLLSLMQQGGELTESQVNTLLAISQQDPKMAGPAVHTALGMLPECAKLEGPQAYVASGEGYLEGFSKSSERNLALTNRANGQLLIFPNPTTSTFMLKGPWNGPGNLYISDLQGRMVLSQTFTGAEVITELAPNTPSGVYLVKIAMSDGTTFVEKLIVHPK